MQSEQPVSRTVLSINVSMAIFVVGDVFVKVLGETYPPGEIIFGRGCIVIALLGTILTAKGHLGLAKMLTGPMVARGLFDCVNIFSFVTAVMHMNMAELYALLLTSPLMMTAIAAVFLKEPVGWRRWLAVIAGFIGALLIIKPGVNGLNVWAALGLLSALAAALREVVTARIGAAATTLQVTLLSATFALLLALPIGLTETWQPVATSDALLWLALTLTWIAGSLLLVYACRLGPMIIVASFRYMLLVWGALAGYFVFGNVPDRWSIVGAAIIGASGLYVYYRETVRKRPVAAPANVRM